MTTPRADGFRFPAEWEPHAATWISWPHNTATWPRGFDGIPGRFAELIRLIASHEQVCVLVPDHSRRTEAESLLEDVATARFYTIATNDAWIRDYGPMFVIGPKSSVKIVDWCFNSWGEKYPPFALDDRVPASIAEHLDVQRYQVDLVLEGGAIDHNGAGTMLASARSILGSDRNPGSNRKEISAILRAHCCVDTIHWMDGEVAGDDTDGHTDQLARFIDRSTIVFAAETSPHDVNYGSLRRLEAQLQRIRLADGSRPELVPLPMPPPVVVDGDRLPASYLNFYFVNGGIVVPQFGAATDAVVLSILRKRLPNRTILPFFCRELIEGLGGIHCLTQQQPLPTDSDSHHGSPSR